MVYAALDIHKSAFQAGVLDAKSGALEEERFSATPAALEEWAARMQGRVSAIALEATTGWRWVVACLQRHDFDVHLVDPGRASALQGSRRRPKTDRLDARWLVTLLAHELTPESWIPPEEIQRLRDSTRLRKALSDERRRWAQRLHALLQQEGWACERDRLLTGKGRRWVEGLLLAPAARSYVETALAMICALELELTRFARSDRRCQALMTIYGVGPILACHLLAEIGEGSRFRRARQVVRLSGLDPVVHQSAEKRRRGRLSKAGSPYLRYALVQAAQQARRRSSPDNERYLRLASRIGKNRAKLTVARAIAARAHRILCELEREALAA